MHCTRLLGERQVQVLQKHGATQARFAIYVVGLVQNVAYGTFDGDVSELQECAGAVQTFLEQLEAKMRSQPEEDDNDE